MNKRILAVPGGDAAVNFMLIIRSGNNVKHSQNYVKSLSAQCLIFRVL